jgi:hypothetical protein
MSGLFYCSEVIKFLEEYRFLGCGALYIFVNQVSEEGIASIFRVEKSVTEEQA